MKSKYEIWAEAKLEKSFHESWMWYLLALPEETAIIEWCKIVTKTLWTLKN